jgi:SAM-dependent methyltransferase
LWDNRKLTAVLRLDALSQMYDAFSQQRLVDAGIPADGQCLEICAGDRDMAGWLAQQAGPDGHALAIDIDPQHITPHPRLTILTHHLLTDALPEGPFDVIHARDVVQHMPDPQQFVNELIAALAPGGILALEDVVPDWANAVLDSPDPRARDIFESFGFAWANVLRRTRDHGSWIGRTHQAMMRHGLAEVTTVGHEQSSPGGTGTCLLVDATASEHRDRLFDAGMRGPDLDLLTVLARDPRLVLLSPRLLSTVGRKPA